MTYETTITGLSPTFRWRLNGSASEVGGHTTNTNGTMSWATSIIPNVAGQCWQSNGSARINPSNSSQINTDSSTQRRSISLWVEFDSVSGTAARCVYEEGGGTHGWGLIQYGSDLVFNMTQSGQSRAHAVHTGLTADTLYHILAVFDLTDQSGSDNMWLYVNGSLSDSALFDRQNFLNSHGGDVQIGQTHDGRDPSGYSGSDANFAGRIQDVCYWSEVELTAANAAAIHTAGTAAAGTARAVAATLTGGSTATVATARSRALQGSVEAGSSLTTSARRSRPIAGTFLGAATLSGTAQRSKAVRATLSGGSGLSYKLYMSWQKLPPVFVEATWPTSGPVNALNQPGVSYEGQYPDLITSETFADVQITGRWRG